MAKIEMSTIQYVIRADGNGTIGSGHLMRCLTIAEELSKRFHNKEAIRFCCSDELSAKLPISYGYEVDVLGTAYDKMEEELPLLTERYGDQSDFLLFLVDSYYITQEYLKRLRKIAPVFLLDDLGSTAYPVDVVINYNVFADSYSYEKLYEGSQTKYYIGSQYIPLREQFVEAKGKEKSKTNMTHVLITTGGGDKEHIGSSILQAFIQSNETKTFHYHLVSGPFQPDYEKLKEWEKTYDNIHIYQNVSNMAKLMCDCDIAVTAGGTTIYELSSLGIPFICFSYADNQVPLTKYMKVNNVAGYAGDFRKNKEVVINNIKEWTKQIARDQEAKQEISFAVKKMVDGKGSRRIADLMFHWCKEVN
ncbi:UDP-2,4-diacetamido-2,4,6-trideoxy-beta-L-altropyranose hydrolase [Lachnospiraceae bacterium OttesenSCG-928-D06]|nr:UDP-2,4-diacetamido-2,4,6-trideoxy-beta-L-altropyranose hydrolase [Lachnospiraceae bacterium OttesenSCG-928-D06]